MEKVFEESAKQIKTKEDLISLLNQINSIQGLIFKDLNSLLSEKAKEKISQDFKKKLEKLEKENIISKNPEKNQIFFENFKKYLENIPQVKITTSFQPQKESINKISSWLKKEIKENVILDLIFNPEITGGIIIEYQGRQIDLSLAKKIEELKLNFKD